MLRVCVQGTSPSCDWICSDPPPPHPTPQTPRPNTYFPGVSSLATAPIALSSLLAASVGTHSPWVCGAPPIKAHGPLVPPCSCFESAPATMLSEGFVLAFIPVCSVVGIVFAIYLWNVVAKVQLVGGSSVVRSQQGREYLLVSGCAGVGEIQP